MKDQFVVDTVNFAIEHCQLFTHIHATKSLNLVSKAKEGYLDCEYALFLHFCTSSNIFGHIYMY
jgi:hypothetical protein